MTKLAPFVVAGLLALGVGGPAHADPLLELGLAIDVSGSITPADFNLQKSAYINVLSNIAVLPQDGSVAIGVISFSTNVTSIFPTTVITAATIGSLISAIQTKLVDTGGATAIGDAITYLSNQILNNSISSTSQKIDVSTDGVGNTGSNQITAANSAVAAGIDQVNCLGIGSAANCNFSRGVGSFSVQATDFASFQDSLERKIMREVGPTPVPEPGTLAILGLGLAGFASMRRRMLGWFGAC